MAKACGLAGQTSSDPIGLGLASQVAEETDRAFRARADRSSRCLAAGRRSLDGGGTMSGNPPTWWWRSPETLGIQAGLAKFLPSIAGFVVGPGYLGWRCWLQVWSAAPTGLAREAGREGAKGHCGSGITAALGL
jgi:hypothetical protein